MAERMNVPLVDLNRQYQTIEGEINEAIGQVVRSGHFILGAEVDSFEKEIAAFCGVKHAIGVASGTDALLLSLRAIGVGPGDRVITPPFTFFATAGMICNLGATPVFVDIEPQTFNIDPQALSFALESDAELAKAAKAVIPVHLYGQTADMDPIMKLARQYELSVIEDAAQAIGAAYKGCKAGTIGQLGCFSFFPTKNLGAYGDAGMIITNDDALAEKLRLLRVHGSKPKYYHRMVGYNSRLDALQAAILRAKLPHLDRWSCERAAHAAQYDEMLSRLEGIEPPVVAEGRTHIYHQYTIRVREGKRNALQGFLRERGIGTEIYYPLPLHLQECFASLGYREGDLPEAERASSGVLSLPVFPELTSVEMTYIDRTLREFFGVYEPSR
jgi:dTDP-4-amino-4,6-dideoxygalactose transaminase